MDKEKLTLLVETLNKAEKNEREAIVAKLAEENGLKTKDLWKLLKEAGFDPGSAPPNSTPPAGQPSVPEKKQPVILRHKTDYPRYRRAGLVLTQKAETYEVTEEQLAKLKRDKWVVIGEDKKASE